MAASFAFLRDLRPYKTAWRVQVKVLHQWRQHTDKSGETWECIFADSQGTKIHVSINRNLVVRFANQLPKGEWKFVENFSLTHASGQFRPTSHVYKMNFVNSTIVTNSDNVSDSQYLSVAQFPQILNDQVNPCILVDVMGEVVNIGQVEVVEGRNNKPTKKIDFELRDANDDRMPVTLWGTFADEVFQACDEAYSNGLRIICLLRFAKIKAYQDTRSVSNSFDVSQLSINPPFPEIAPYINILPNDGLVVAFHVSRPRRQLTIANEPDLFDYKQMTIAELKNSSEVGRVKVVCQIYGIDTDWAWYYFSCKKCNKKVTHVYTDSLRVLVVEKPKTPKFWCDTCRSVVTNVLAKYKLHVKVMDKTGESKLMLFDTAASDIVTQSASTLLGGSYDEIADPEDVPDALNNIKGRSFQMIVCVEKENLWSGLDTFKVLKVLSSSGIITEQHAHDDSDNNVNSLSITSGDQVSLTMTASQDEKEDSTPSSKHVLDPKDHLADQSSTSKRLHLETVDLDDRLDDENIGKTIDDEGNTFTAVCSAVKIKNDDAIDEKKFKDIKIKMEPKDRR